MTSSIDIEEAETKEKKLHDQWVAEWEKELIERGLEARGADEDEVDEAAQAAIETLEATFGRMDRGRRARNIIDISDAVVKLVDEYDWSQSRIGRTFGASQPTVSNHYSLRLLIPELRERARNGEMSGRAAVALSKMIEEEQREIYEDTKDLPKITQERVGIEGQSHVEALPIGNIPIPGGEARPDRKVELVLSKSHRDALWSLGECKVWHQGTSYTITQGGA